MTRTIGVRSGMRQRHRVLWILVWGVGGTRVGDGAEETEGPIRSGEGKFLPPGVPHPGLEEEEERSLRVGCELDPVSC